MKPAISNPDNDRLLLHAAIGEAVCAWAGLEDRLCWLYAYALDIPEASSLAAKAFYPVVSFDARLKLADSILKHRLQDDDWALQKWKSLQAAIAKKNKIRNKFAHCQIHPLYVNGDYRGTYLLPYYTMFSLFDLTTKDHKKFIEGRGVSPPWWSSSFKLNDVKEQVGAFLDLSHQIYEFCNQLRGHMPREDQ